MEILDNIISYIIGAASVVVAIYIYRKTQQWEKEKEARKELKEKQAADEGKAKKKSEVENYCDHIEQKFKYLDFTGLNAILQKPLMLEDIYVKLRARKSSKLTNYRTIADFKLLDEERENAVDKGWQEKTTKPTGLMDGDFAAVFESMYKEASQKREPLKMVILGQPGSGKTTLMKWVALQSVHSAEGIFSRFMPVFIPLKDLGREPDKTFRPKISGK